MQFQIAYNYIWGCYTLRILAERLKEERLLQGKTQEEMANLLNVKRATYGEYERGNNLPPVDKLKTIAEDFNVSIDYLVGNAEKQINVNELLNHIEMIKMIACSLENIIK